MKQVMCPKCGTAINLDESDYEGIVRQVRDEQFARELEERAVSLRREKEQELELARTNAAGELEKTRSELEAALREEPVPPRSFARRRLRLTARSSGPRQTPRRGCSRVLPSATPGSRSFPPSSSPLWRSASPRSGTPRSARG